MTPEEIAKANQDGIDALKLKLEDCVSKADLAGVSKALDEFVAKFKDVDVTSIKTSLEDIAEQIAQIKDKQFGKGVSKTMEDAVADFLTEKSEEIKAAFKSGKAVEFTVEKAVGDVTTANATHVGSVPEVFYQQNNPASNVNLRSGNVLNYVNQNDTDLPVYAYTDAIPGEGDFAIVAEGAVKPQIDLDIQTRFATPVKIAAWIKVTEEAVQDIKGLRSIINNYLRKKHDRKKDKLILFGTGASGQPEGASVVATTFPLGTGMAGSVDGTANIMQVINAGITAIFTRHNYSDEGNYMANMVRMNPIDFFTNFVAATDGEGRPLYPMATLFNTVIIGGVTIVPDEDIPVGKILIADLTKYNVFNYMPYTVKIGWVNDDFIKNQFVILAESRFHAFVKNLDRLAFIYDDIATIKNNLENGTPSA